MMALEMKHMYGMRCVSRPSWPGIREFDSPFRPLLGSAVKFQPLSLNYQTAHKSRHRPFVSFSQLCSWKTQWMMRS